MSIEHFPTFDEVTPTILFTSEEITFQLAHETATGEWLKKVIEREEKQLRSLNFIFCTDQYLHRINVAYLDHDTYTDVITFHYDESPVIAGDIFISIERVQENATKYGVEFSEELNRVMVHGVLHLCGYGDKTAVEKEEMRKKEMEALAAYRPH